MGSYFTKPGSSNSSLNVSTASTSDGSYLSNEKQSASCSSRPETEDLDSPMEENIQSFRSMELMSQTTFSAGGSGVSVTEQSVDTSGSVSIVLELTDPGEYRPSNVSEGPFDDVMQGLEQAYAGEEDFGSISENAVVTSPAPSTVPEAGNLECSMVSEQDEAPPGDAVFDEMTRSSAFEPLLDTETAPPTMVDIPRREKKRYQIGQNVYVKTTSKNGNYWFPGRIADVGVSNWKQLDSHTMQTAVCYKIRYISEDAGKRRIYKCKEECIFAECFMPDTVNAREIVATENQAFKNALKKKRKGPKAARSTVAKRHHESSIREHVKPKRVGGKIQKRCNNIM